MCWLFKVSLSIWSQMDKVFFPLRTNLSLHVYPEPFPLVFFPLYQVSILWSVHSWLFKKQPRLLAYRHYSLCLLNLFKWLILEPKGLFTLTSWSQVYSLPSPQAIHRSTAWGKNPHISLLENQISFLNPSLLQLYALDPHSPTLLISQSKCMFAAQSKVHFLFLPDHCIHLLVLHHCRNNKLALIYFLTKFSESFHAFPMQKEVS